MRYVPHNDQPPAGWYSDPEKPERKRYWTGLAWTDQISPPEPEPEPEPEPVPEVDALNAPADNFNDLPLDQRETRIPQPPESSHEASAAEIPPQPFAVPGSEVDRRLIPPAPPSAHTNQVAPAATQKVGPDGQVLADYGRRAGGFIVDWLIVTAGAGLIALIVVGGVIGFDSIFDQDALSELFTKAQENPGYQPTEAEATAIFGPNFGAAVFWVVGLWCLGSFLNGVVLVVSTGQTLGDRLVSVRKVRAGRRLPGYGSALVRWLIPLMLVLLAPFTCLLSLLLWVADHAWPIWEPMRRTWQDLAAGTVVERADLIGPPQR